MSGLGRDRRHRQFRQQAADDRPDQERARYVDRHARHLPHAFRLGRQHQRAGLDYRFDVSSSKIDSFIDGDYQQLNNVSGQLNYRVNDAFKVFAAVDYKRDDGHAYWGTPLTTTAFSGPFSTHGVVAGSAVNTFTGDLISPVTVDSRTTRTNYNVADNRIGAHELWLRGGFELKVTRRTSPSRTRLTSTAQNATG